MSDEALELLLLIDLQVDFLPGGALAVREGDEVIPIANALAPRFSRVAATQDWHPATHASFASQYEGRKVGEVIELDGMQQVLWPDHCVQGTPGAGFAPELDMRHVSAIFRKGTDARIDSYSGFFDNGHRKSTGLAGYLRELGVKHVHLMGLATDYCVKFSALDARREGFEVSLILPGCRGVELEAGDVACALEELRSSGVRIVESVF